MKLRYSIPTLALLCTFASATTVKDVVRHTLQNNQDITSKSFNNEAFKKYVDEQRGGYYPKLDLTASVEKKKIDENYKTGAGTDSNVDYRGGNAQLDLEQLLYDGNLTPSLVDEAKANYTANKYKNSNDVEEIVYDSITAYLNIMKYDERITVSKDNLNVYNNYLSISEQTEKINGEILDKVQTKAKIHNAKSSLFEEQNSKSTALSSFAKNVGMKLEKDVCRPVIDEQLIPSKLEDVYKLALKNNYQILEQIQSIEAQRAVVEQANSNFLPTLKLKMQALEDRDLLDKDLKTNQYSGKVELTYNLFNGLIDSAKSEREVLFLKESQAKLDVVSKSVLEEVTVAFDTYNTSKKQIDELKQFIEENKQIITIYKDQFDAGTRSFIDVLNVEADLYNSKINLINTEYTQYQAYYQLLKSISTLQTAIANSNQEICQASNNVSTKSSSKEDDAVKQLLSENTDKKVSSSEQIMSSVSNEYVIFLESLKDINSAQKTLDTVSASLKNDVKAKIISNSNGTHTVTLYNINGAANAESLKAEFISKYPNLYYVKKK